MTGEKFNDFSAGEILKIKENRKLFINFSAPHLITLYLLTILLYLKLLFCFIIINILLPSTQVTLKDESHLLQSPEDHRGVRR